MLNRKHYLKVEMEKVAPKLDKAMRIMILISQNHVEDSSTKEEKKGGDHEPEKDKRGCRIRHRKREAGHDIR